MRLRSRRLVYVSALVLCAAATSSRVWAHTDPPGCFQTGTALLLGEFFDTDNNMVGDTPVDRPKLDGEIIYLHLGG